MLVFTDQQLLMTSFETELLNPGCWEWGAHTGVLKLACYNWGTETGLLKSGCSNWDAEI